MNLTLQNKGSFLTRFLLIGVFLVTLSMPTWAQEKITVSGKILDNTNEPLLNCTPKVGHKTNYYERV